VLAHGEVAAGELEERQVPRPESPGRRRRRPKRPYDRQSSPGMIRRMNSSNRGTVKAVSPWLGLQTIPFETEVRQFIEQA
jgi:hypothetical protein